MTHREARMKLGTRSRRRANTNGKVIGMLTNNRARKRKNPTPRKKSVALAVLKLVKGITVR